MPIPYELLSKAYWDAMYPNGYVTPDMVAAMENEPLADDSVALLEPYVYGSIPRSDIQEPEQIPVDPQQSRNDWASKALAAGQGLASIIGTAKGLMQVSDTTQQRNMIRSIADIGNDKYGNYYQAFEDSNRINMLQPDLTYKTYRGGSTGQRAAGILGATATGASTGAMVGGPWGAVIGGAIGGGLSTLGTVLGGNLAEAKLDRDKANLNLARSIGAERINYGIEDLQEADAKNKMYNLSASGGQIERKEQSVKEFADRVLGKAKTNDVTRSSGIKREYVKGGVKISIKR